LLYVTFCLDAKSNQKDQVQPDRSARLDGQLTAAFKARSECVAQLIIPYNLALFIGFSFCYYLGTCYAG